MNKEKLYQQIEEFNTTLTDPSDKNSKTYQEARLYVNSDEAIDKATFIKFLINNKYMNTISDTASYNTILDMTFGSGNLTSHIVFDNDIFYRNIILNDKNTEKTNQNIKEYIDNCSIVNHDILEDNISIINFRADLVILNPQLGGNYIDGDLYKQRQEKETNKDILNKLSKNITNFLNNKATIIFYGAEKDFISIFGECNYIRYKASSQQLYVVNKIFKEKICFKKVDNSFEKIDCENKSSNDNDEVLDFDNLTFELDEFDKLEQKDKDDYMKETKKIKFSDEPKGNLNFKYKNILFKGVPGTGKSRAIDKIIENKLELSKNDKNVLRINIHSASSNSDLMQGIGISSNNGNIKYSEKQGLILDIIKRATFNPNQPFVLILEEIQENSLNELIGDLIYLIEDNEKVEESKRAKLTADDKEYKSYEELINELVENDNSIHYVEIPYLVNDSTDYKKMIMPSNLFIFCTSNYRDDKKIIEDNLLRRFEVIEIYPDETIVDKYARDFFKELNKSILENMKENGEIHPDRFLIGHAIWKDVDNKDKFYKAFSKLITEFKDIREIEFDTFKNIVNELTFPADVEIDFNEDKNTYYDLIKDIQSKINYGFID